MVEVVVMAEAVVGVVGLVVTAVVEVAEAVVVGLDVEAVMVTAVVEVAEAVVVGLDVEAAMVVGLVVEVVVTAEANRLDFASGRGRIRK